MKQLFIISISLSLFVGGLIFNKHNPPAKAGVHIYWLKKNKKEMLRDSEQTNAVKLVIDNALHFVGSGFSARYLNF